MNVLIAGGTGLIGSRLTELLLAQGHAIKILTRNPRADHHVAWNPATKELNTEAVRDIEVIINLCGAGIAEKNWTKKRKKELLHSRIDPIQFLFEKRSEFPQLKHFLTASGISCYGFDTDNEPYAETDPFGPTYIDQLVKQWEAAADLFQEHVSVTKLRIAIVLSSQGGAVEQLVRPMKWNMAAALGSGKQTIPWIHIDDVALAFIHLMENNTEGTFNALTDNTSNRELTKALAHRLGKRIWMPNVPGFLLKLMLGEMSIILLKGVKVSNDKLINSGFKSRYENLETAIEALDF